MGKTTREQPTIIVDTSEPHAHVRADDRDPCAICGAKAYRPCEPVFAPCVFGPCSREMPYADRPRVVLPFVRANLDEGDYSLPGLEKRVAVERKSGPDMLRTMFGEGENTALGERAANLDRFRAELERVYAARFEFFAIVSEQPQAWYFTEARRRFEKYGKAFDPFALFAILRSFAIDLAVPTIWCGSKGLAEVEVGATLARVWSQATGGADAKKAARRGYGSIPWLGALDGVIGDAPEVATVPDAASEPALPAVRLDQAGGMTASSAGYADRKRVAREAEVGR